MERFRSTLPNHSDDAANHPSYIRLGSNTNITYAETFLLNSATHTIHFQDFTKEDKEMEILRLDHLRDNSMTFTATNQLVARENGTANVHYFNLTPSFYYYFKPFNYLMNTSIMSNTLNITSYFDNDPPNVQIDSGISKLV